MVLSADKMREIERKASLGIPLVNSSDREAVKYYSTVQEIKRKAEFGIPLVSSTPYKSNLYTTFGGKVGQSPSGSVNSGGSSIPQGDGGTPQYSPTAPVGNSPVGQTPSNGGLLGGLIGSPVLDQTPPVIGNTDTNNQPAVPIGTGAGNPVNSLELNSLIAVGIGFIFIRGAFKLLTKIF